MKLLASLVLSLSATLCAADQGWSFADTPGSRDVLFNGKVVLRHMNAFDASSKERRHETFKTFTHVFDFDGKLPITKGPYGRFTHHRGCFIGWNKTIFEGQSYDFWHCPKVERKHVKYLDESKAGADAAVLSSVTDWPTAEGKVVIHETQKITAKKISPTELQLDFDFTLEAPNGPVKLEGDLQHAGFHFRAADDVVEKQTAYILPESNVTKKGDALENCNWVVCQFSTAGYDMAWTKAKDTREAKEKSEAKAKANAAKAKGEPAPTAPAPSAAPASGLPPAHRYAVGHFNDPKNPTPLQYSTRAYGRFGAFSKTEVSPGTPLKLHYRITVIDAEKGTVPAAAEWQKRWDAFAAGK